VLLVTHPGRLRLVWCTVLFAAYLVERSRQKSVYVALPAYHIGNGGVRSMVPLIGLSFVPPGQYLSWTVLSDGVASHDPSSWAVAAQETHGHKIWDEVGGINSEAAPD